MEYIIQPEIAVQSINTQQILEDLRYCVTNCDVKVSKRLNRLRALLDMMGIDSAHYIAQLTIRLEKNVAISDQDIMNFLSKPQEPTYEPIRYAPDNEVDDSVKKAIEAELTSKLNADGYLYKITCRNLTHVLYNRLCKNKRYKHLFNTDRLFMVHKGSVAMRYALLKEFPDKLDVINEWFKFGGDNDVCIMIDPHLDDFDEIHKDITKIMLKFLNDKVSSFSQGCIATQAKKVKNIKVGNINMRVVPAVRQSFVISTAPNGDKIQTNSVERNSAYTSYNELDFKGPSGRRAGFGLGRIKLAFTAIPESSDNAQIDIPPDHPGRVCGAEVLDISISTLRDEKYIDTFHHYASGMYIDPHMRV